MLRAHLKFLPVLALLLFALAKASPAASGVSAVLLSPAVCGDCVMEKPDAPNVLISRAAPDELKKNLLGALSSRELFPDKPKVKAEPITDRVKGLVALSGWELKVSATGKTAPFSVRILGGDSALFHMDSGLGPAMEAMKKVPFGPFEKLQALLESGGAAHQQSELDYLTAGYEQLRFAFYRHLPVGEGVLPEGDVIFTRCERALSEKVNGEDRWEGWIACLKEMDRAAYTTRIEIIE